MLIIVTGRPAAGKSTLAKWLGNELQIPIASKDSIREILFDTLGWKDRDWASLLGRVSIELMFHFAEAALTAGKSLILDNAFAPQVTEPRILELQQKYDFQAVQIICDTASETLFNRFQERAAAGGRHPGHGDEDVLDQLWRWLAEESSPVMALGGPVIRVDTADFAQVNYQEVLAKVRKFTQAPSIDKTNQD